MMRGNKEGRKEGEREGKGRKGTEDGVEENPSGINTEEPGSNIESLQWPILMLNVTSLNFHITTRWRDMQSLCLRVVTSNSLPLLLSSSSLSLLLLLLSPVFHDYYDYSYYNHYYYHYYYCFHYHFCLSGKFLLNIFAQLICFLTYMLCLCLTLLICFLI